MELVTTVEGPPGLDVRLAELLARNGRENADVVFEIVRATRAQGAPIDKVIRHECRHDEGEPDCSSAPRVEA